MSLPVSVAASELLTVTVTVDGGSVVVSAAGEIDCSSAPPWAAALEGAVSADAVEVTVDLTAVTFLDSAGVHALAATYRRAEVAGIRLRVLATHRAVLRPLQLTGLWDRLAAGPGAVTGPLGG